MNLFEGKNIIVGVTGGIAAYKTASLVSMLSKTKANVDVIMTKNACNFINPITFESLTGNKCIVDTFDRNFSFEIEHISLAKKTDLIIVAPATANVIAKLSVGIADDMLTTTVLASKCKKIIAPAMNCNMYENSITQKNIENLKREGFLIVEPKEGLLACKDMGKGKMEEPEILFQYMEREIGKSKTLEGKKILISLGATLEPIDPVRYITNHSTGKMGVSLAREGVLRGADVTIVKGNTNLDMPLGTKVIEAKRAREMFETIKDIYEEFDIIVMTAAISDYFPLDYKDEKIKKKDDEENLVITLGKNPDILKFLGENKRSGQYICGFSMETENMVENSKKKLLKKNADLIVANNLKEKGAGFKEDTNLVTFITRDEIKEQELKTKDEVASDIFDFIETKTRK